MPPELRFLKTLVTTLTVVMIVGLLVIVALLVIRLQPAPSGDTGDLPALPAHLALPAGSTAQAVTLARDWVVVVDQAGTIHLFDRARGDLLQSVAPVESPD